MVEILVVRERNMSPLAELNDPANADIKSLVSKFDFNKERHTILTVATESAAVVLERVNAFQSVVRAYVCR